jgi:nucleoside-diphosphate-sugar epimerase
MHVLQMPSEEISEIVANSEEFLKKLSGAKVLIVGGTGFIGRWVTSSLLEASSKFGIEIELLVRNKEKTSEQISRFKNASVRIHGIRQAGEIRGVTHIIHGATPSSPSTGGTDMEAVYKTSMDVGNLLVEIAKYCNVPIFMHLSSGAVYGPKPIENTLLSENESVSEYVTDFYMKSKIDLEALTENASKGGWVKGSNPRLFAFAGPGITLDAHFAVGNFMQQAREGSQITLQGNPNTMRSYLYPVDMTTWLLASLANPSLEVTHIGSDIGYTMSEIATVVASEFKVEANISGNLRTPANFYIPETTATKKRLNVSQTIDLPEAIRRWRKWLES